MTTETDPTSAFESALATQGVACERTPLAGLTDRLVDAVTDPAVGVPLPFAPDALGEAGVATSFSPTELQAARTGVTPVEFAIAEYGTLAIPSSDTGHESVALYPETHVAVVLESDLAPGLSSGFDRLAESFRSGTDSVVFATGPSATADMGGLVQGVHGPGEVRVIVVTDR